MAVVNDVAVDELFPNKDVKLSIIIIMFVLYSYVMFCSVLFRSSSWLVCAMFCSVLLLLNLHRQTK